MQAADVRDDRPGVLRQTIALLRTLEHHGLCLLTGDFDFADIRDYPPEDYPGSVVFVLPDDANRDIILHLMKAFFKIAAMLEQLPGRSGHR